MSKNTNDIDQRFKTFLENAKIIHDDKYEYCLVKYVNSHTKIKIICPEHGIFAQLPVIHLKGSGCPKCEATGFSKMAISWLQQISLKENIFIQHALNTGEFCIPNTKFKADGYCEETNTIYEFHGDCFHGNPNIFYPEQHCHPYNKQITALELFERTIDRENEIKNLGYTLITIWERDFKDISSNTLFY